MKTVNNLNQMKKSFQEMNLLIVTDKKGKVLYYNNFGDRYNMLGNKNPIGRSIFKLYPWLTKENSTIFKVINSGEAIVNETQVVKIDEHNMVRAVNSAFPLINEDGILGAIEISIDLDQNIKDNKNQGIVKSLNAKYHFNDFITQNQKMIEIIKKLKKSSCSNSNIFIYGETGTGKELLAHSIHNNSPRKNKPFITQNCAAIPASLMESVLFGTTEGGFTDAKNKQGIFELADGGTIFLDEINSMPYEMQAKLLRVLESNKIRRIGAEKETHINVRIIASTNEDPDILKENNKLRSDLYYRLNVVNVNIPPLRNRKNDIPLLTEYFIKKFNHLFNKNINNKLNQDIIDSLKMYYWPGNVRELRNCIENTFNHNITNTITKENLPDYIFEDKQNLIDNNKSFNLEDKVNNYEKKIIVETLHSNKFNISKTAKELNIPRSTLYYKIKKLNINIS